MVDYQLTKRKMMIDQRNFCNKKCMFCMLEQVGLEHVKQILMSVDQKSFSIF